MKKRKHFVVTELHLEVMALQAQGYMAPYIAKEVGKNVSTILNWQGNEVYKRTFNKYSEMALKEFDAREQARILSMFRLDMGKLGGQGKQRKRKDKMREDKIKEEEDIMLQMSKRGQV